MTKKKHGWTKEQIKKMQETGFYPVHYTVTLSKKSKETK